MALPEVTMERLEAAVKRAGLNYKIDENDGELGFGFDDLVVWLNLNQQEGWRTYAIWRPEFAGEEVISTVLDAVNQVNATLVIPKSMLRISEENGVLNSRVIFENCTPVFFGLSDEQIFAHLQMVVAGFFMAMKQLTDLLPHLVNSQSTSNEANSHSSNSSADSSSTNPAHNEKNSAGTTNSSTTE